MPLPTTHALVPLAGALAIGNASVRRPLLIWAALAAAAPDLDCLTDPDLWSGRWGVPDASIFSHRGAAHSLFAAVAIGLVAAAFHRRLGVRPLAAAVIIGAAMATHGILDMMTDASRPVAYLWPLSSARLVADWRPIHSSPITWTNLPSLLWARQLSELREVIVPMFAAALGMRGARTGFLLYRRWSR